MDRRGRFDIGYIAFHLLIFMAVVIATTFVAMLAIMLFTGQDISILDILINGKEAPDALENVGEWKWRVAQ